MSTSLYVVFHILALQLSSARVSTNSSDDKKPQELYEDKSVILTRKLGDFVHIDIGHYDPKRVKIELYTPKGKVLQISKQKEVPKSVIDATENIKTSKVDIEVTKDKEDGKLSEVYNASVLIGPLVTEDHGNWLLSKYVISENGLKEIFKTITIEIIENIQQINSSLTLKKGDTLNISFPYPLKNIELCQLIVPTTTSDRYYDRDKREEGRCGYTLPDVDERDQGTWGIIASGDIVYKTNVYVTVNDSSAVEHNYV